jgi:group I intron endonuclease
MKICGIYKISSLKSLDKFYIGSSVNIKNRWNLHKCRLEKNVHHSPILQAYANKYGIDSLKFEIIELCNRENILIREQYYIDTLNPYLNVCRIAGNHLGRKCSEKSIERMRIAKSNISEETRKRISISAKARGWPNRIRVMSEEQKKKISISHMGNKYNLGHKWSEEQRIKFIASRRGKPTKMRGRKLPQSQKDKIGLANTGKVRSPETRLKISIAKKGKKLKSRKVV